MNNCRIVTAESVLNLSKKRTVLLGIGLFISSLLWAQVKVDSSVSTKENNNLPISYFNQSVQLKLGVNSKTDAILVNDGNSKIDIRPNAALESRLYVNYRFISFSVRYLPLFLKTNRDEEEKGKTASSGFAFNFTVKKWMQHFAYHRTTGYYLDNTKEFNPGWTPGDPYTQFPDLRLTTYEGATIYKFNNQYSVNAVVNQTERQEKSAGSWMPGLFYRYYIADDRTVLTTGGSSQKSNNWELMLGLGYQYTIVLPNHFYVALGATPALGGVWTNLDTRFTGQPTIRTQQNEFIFRWEGNGGIGYNGSRWFAGLYGKVMGTSAQQQNTTVLNQQRNFFFQGFVGYRFKAPNWLKQSADKAAEKLPII